MNAVELLPQGTKPQRPTAIAYEWPITLGASDTMHTDLSWSLVELGAPASTAKDLLRVVAAAYIADRTNSRPAQALQRDLHLSVHLDEPQAWTPAALNHTVDLLHWLTGDIWTLEVLAAQPAPDLAEHAPTAGHVRAVSLLSGGLDSLCGALLRLDQAESTLFLGHVDSANAVSKAQRAIHDQLRERRPELRYQRYALRPTGPVRESTPRTRSLLFMAMAVAAASGNGASEVVVPENGFTSINPPLEPSRGGPLTTRSTHPWTFHALSELMRALSLDTIAVHNPYGHLTKGELVAEALRPRSADDRHLAAVTLSCAKPNAGRPRAATPTSTAACASPAWYDAAHSSPRIGATTLPTSSTPSPAMPRTDSCTTDATTSPPGGTPPNWDSTTSASSRLACGRPTPTSTMRSPSATEG